MTAVERLQNRHNEIAREVATVRSELFPEDEASAPDEARCTELRDRLGTLATDYERTQSDLDLARQTEGIQEIRQLRADTRFGQDDGPQNGNRAEQSIERDLTPPTARQIFDQDMLAKRHLAGQDLSEADKVTVFRSTAAERLFGRVLLARSGGRSQNTLSDAEWAAWRAYQRNRAEAERAINTNDFNITTATEGSEFVPTALETTIFGARSYAGPLAGDELVTAYRSPSYGNLDIPTMGILTAGDKAEATDSVAKLATTGKVSFTPKDKEVFIVASEQIMMTPVNFETHISTEAGRALGRLYNTERSVGSGTSPAMQGFAGYTASALNSREVATAATIVEADVLAMLALLEYSNIGNPNTMIMFHASVLWHLWATRDATGGISVFNVNPATGMLIFPGGINYAVNNGLQALGTDDNKVMGVGDFSRYGVYYAGGLRAAMDFDVRSGQYHIALRQWTDGSPIDASSFRFMADK